MSQTVSTRFAAALLSLLLIMSQDVWSQKPEPADPLMEASIYMRQARGEKDCSTKRALEWADKAQGAIDRFRSHSQRERDTAGVLKAEAELLKAEAKNRERQLKIYERDIPRLINQGRITTAVAMLDQQRAEAPTCDPRFDQWFRTAAERGQQADRFAEKGDSVVNTDPKLALEFYRASRVQNIETRNMEFRMQQAEAMRKNQHRSGHAVAKVIGWTLILGGAAAGAYYGSQRYEDRRNKH